jgi:hypothetical protein
MSFPSYARNADTDIINPGMCRNAAVSYTRHLRSVGPQDAQDVSLATLGAAHPVLSPALPDGEAALRYVRTAFDANPPRVFLVRDPLIPGHADPDSSPRAGAA